MISSRNLLKLITLTVFLVSFTAAQQIDNQYVCAASSRNAKCFSYLLVAGCKCTNDGKCTDTKVDVCSDCSDSNVYAVAPYKTCAQVVSQGNSQDKSVTCTPESRNSDFVCAAVVRDYGCVKYADGSQRYIPVNTCTCQNKDIVSYELNKTCPTIEAPQKPPKIQIDDQYVCAASSRNAKCFSYLLVEGCKCTTDGKCTDTKVDVCNDCSDSNVYAVAPYKTCAQVVKNSSNDQKNSVVCDAKSRNSDRVCAAVVKDYGCVHYANGSQKYVPVNACTCQNKNIKSYDLNQQCKKVSSGLTHQCKAKKVIKKLLSSLKK